MQVYAAVTLYSEEYINSFYNDVDETRETKPLHDSDGRLKCSNRERINTMEMATGKIGFEMRNERRDTLIE